MIPKHKVWVVIVLALIVVLPLISWYVMKKGFEVRMNAEHSNQYKPSNIAVTDYQLISQRGDTISKQRMLGKVCAIEFFHDTCFLERYQGRHPLFELQEDYYQKTRAFRILSVSLSDRLDIKEILKQYGDLYAAREIWHVLGSNQQMAIELFGQCNLFLEKNNQKAENYLCPPLVFLISKDGFIYGAYNASDSIQFSNLYQDVLFLIDK